MKHPKDDPTMSDADVMRWCRAQGWNAKQTQSYLNGRKQVKERSQSKPSDK